MNFYESREWRELRVMVFLKYGKKCMLCNATDKELHVDHIKPISKYPLLKLDFDNLQILCKDCNLGKSNYMEADFRPRLGSKSSPQIKELKKMRRAIAVKNKRERVSLSSIVKESGFILKKNTYHIWENGNSACNLWDGVSVNKKYRFQKYLPECNFCQACEKITKKMETQKA